MFTQFTRFVRIIFLETLTLRIRPPRPDHMNNIWFPRSIGAVPSRNEDTELAQSDQQRNVLLMRPSIEAIRDCVVLVDRQSLAHRLPSSPSWNDFNLLHASSIGGVLLLRVATRGSARDMHGIVLSTAKYDILALCINSMLPRLLSGNMGK
jgi:hypothetical protein